MLNINYTTSLLQCLFNFNMHLAQKVYTRMGIVIKLWDFMWNNFSVLGANMQLNKPALAYAKLLGKKLKYKIVA